MKYLKYGFLVFFLFLCDQISKYLLQGRDISLFPYVSFQYIENTGAAFSLFQGYNFALIFISLLVFIFVLYYFLEYPLALSFILAGLLGNLFDRIFLGFVRDFIALGIWPIFNLADTWNTIGIALLLYLFWKEEKLNKALSHGKK
mgnify:CR=1 FL=1